MSREDYEYVEVEFDEVRATTQDAVLLAFGDGTREVWVPRSVADQWDRECGTVEVPRWFLEREELEDYAT